MVHSVIDEQLIEAISDRTAEKILQSLFERKRDEMTLEEIRKEFGVSRETIRRRVKDRILSPPVRKRGKNTYSRNEIESLNLCGRL